MIELEVGGGGLELDTGGGLEEGGVEVDVELDLVFSFGFNLSPPSTKLTTHT